MEIVPGTPSDELPEVLAAGRGDATCAFLSLSARDPEGRDESYLEWHGLDHRPEQYRIPGMRHAERFVSTPACRMARAASEGRLDEVDHVMIYLFTDTSPLADFAALGAGLHRGGRMGHRLPSVEVGVYETAGRLAARRVMTGADVIPWRPARGVHLLIEEGSAPPDSLVDVAGVAGIWWYAGTAGPAPFDVDHAGRQLSVCYLDDDPVAVASRLDEPLRRRWADTGVRPLLAAPFEIPVPFDWGRHLP